jgi:hypothetical protein
LKPLEAPDRTRGRGDRIAELELESSRLRRLVTDLLLEKIKLEEAAQSSIASGAAAWASSELDFVAVNINGWSPEGGAS